MSKHIVTCESVPLKIKDFILDGVIERSSGKTSSKDKDDMTIPERDELWEKFARAVYSSGMPFSIVENKFLIEFFQTLKPPFSLPTRKHLAEGLLDAEYNRVLEEMRKNIQTIPGYGVQIDSWSNIRSEPVINIVVTTPEPFLYKTEYTGTEHHTDNASAMKKSWSLLQNDKELENLPNAYYGCAAHTENLLANDILNQPTCRGIQQKVTTVITTVNGSQVLKERLKEIQREIYNKVIALQLPVKTKWCYTLAKCSKVATYLSQNVRYLILDERTWTEADQLCFLLQPIKVWISLLESDKSTISKVPQAANEILNHLRSNLPLSPLTPDEENSILSICEKRSSDMMHPVPYASNILDPEFQGKNLNPEQKIRGYNHILKITLAMELSQQNVHKEVTEYMQYQGFWDNDFLWHIASSLKESSRVWWTTVCSGTVLSKIAAVILGMPSTSAATERTFNVYSNVHTKKRNRLTSDRAGKVVFISKNLQVFYRPDRKYANKDKNNEMDANDYVETVSELFEGTQDCVSFDCEYFREE